MNIILFVLWIVLTAGFMGFVLHAMGDVYGEYVASNMETRIVTFVVCGSIVGLALGYLGWLLS